MGESTHKPETTSLQKQCTISCEPHQMFYNKRVNTSKRVRGQQQETTTKLVKKCVIICDCSLASYLPFQLLLHKTGTVIVNATTKKRETAFQISTSVDNELDFLYQTSIIQGNKDSVYCIVLYEISQLRP